MINNPFKKIEYKHAKVIYIIYLPIKNRCHRHHKSFRHPLQSPHHPPPPSSSPPPHIPLLRRFRENRLSKNGCRIYFSRRLPAGCCFEIYKVERLHYKLQFPVPRPWSKLAAVTAVWRVAPPPASNSNLFLYRPATAGCNSFFSPGTVPGYHGEICNL